jgi:hypothetical protein
MATDDQTPPPDPAVGAAEDGIQTVKDIFSTDPSPPPPPPPPPPTPAVPPIGPPDLDRGETEQDVEEDEAQGRGISVEQYRAGRAAWDQQQQRQFAAQQAAEEAKQAQEAQQAERDAFRPGTKGCLNPAAMAILVGLAVAAAVAVAVYYKQSSSSASKTSAEASSSAAGGAANPENPLDGHWVLVNGLNQPGFDMGVACDTGCQSGRQVTVDKADVTIDISGDKITGGTFKTGYSSTMGDQCTRFDSHVDATVTGGADQVNKYGQLIVDGTQTNTDSCNSNLQPVMTKSKFHTSRFYFLSDPNTLTLCYNIDPNTFNACTTVGFTTPPPSGVAATFKRG